MPWRQAQSAAWLIIAVRQTNTFRLQVATLADFYSMMTLEALCFSMTLRLCSVCCMSKRIENKRWTRRANLPHCMLGDSETLAVSSNEIHIDL